MSRKLVTTVAATAVLVGSQLATALPAQAQVEGGRCGFTSMSDPLGDGDTDTAMLEGGPVTASDTGAFPPALDPTASITITCTLVVGGTRHSVSASGTGVAYLPPTPVSFVAPPGTSLSLCTAVTVNGTTYYWDDTNGGWSTSSSVACPLAISQEDPGPGPDPVEELRLLLDSILCPVLAMAFRHRRRRLRPRRQQALGLPAVRRLGRSLSPSTGAGRSLDGPIFHTPRGFPQCQHSPTAWPTSGRTSGSSTRSTSST